MATPKLALLVRVVADDLVADPFRGVLAGLVLGIILVREHAALADGLWADFLAAGGSSAGPLDAGARDLLDGFLALSGETAVERG